MGEVIAAAAYSAGRKVQDITIEESSEWVAKPGHFVWIGIHAPDERQLRQLQAQFGLHELAIEDAQSFHLRPKMEQYEGIAILATNLRQNMDEAFTRRLQFIVEFPFPAWASRPDEAAAPSRPRDEGQDGRGEGRDDDLEVDPLAGLPTA